MTTANKWGGLNGQWQPLAAGESNPFARANNVGFPSGAWTKDISHGELIRTGNERPGPSFMGPGTELTARPHEINTAGPTTLMHRVCAARLTPTPTRSHQCQCDGVPYWASARQRRRALACPCSAAARPPAPCWHPGCPHRGRRPPRSSPSVCASSTGPAATAN
ncbi:non-reducing end alpha-L-arabinofuranosidase family hydrolase [Streptomyces sp. DSM 41529]|uniref:non-reducing end alpha-L-arabinofuranosidase n=1 Tax=Streptomyces lonegramiae TaxID=3075524 RepID=A0ABU2XVL5_9ACTN|nr:non-reducing end alpha-L-arabinofuranosidase family hydrolase [Streptomyces sp. DSM 41529]MDT0549570.1 non-reducing end alpha-L-arabinofuranosidase family hydrolase [Streptomyces sp. DSM 41529]